jgi:hypothetical protein
LLAGGFATGQLLQEINSRDVRVFVIWEPVLPTDFVAPSTAPLARIPDARALQYSDRKRSLSHLLGERNRSTVVWDYIAVYAPGMLWQDAPPKPIYSDGPVRDVISAAKESVQRVLASSATPGGSKE